MFDINNDVHIVEENVEGSSVYVIDNFYNYINETDANCITLIGVLEHLVDIPNFLKRVKQNKQIKQNVLEVA